jgi:starch phosphorylase
VSVVDPNSDLARWVDPAGRYAADVNAATYFGMPTSAILEAERRLRSGDPKSVAYFSMEFGLATNFYNVFDSARPVSAANKISENDIISNDRVLDYLFDLKIEALLDLPIYSGGLGVLAGDTVKAAADMRLPVVAIGILWNKGYFKQRFWFKFGQLPEEIRWDPASFPGLIQLDDRVKIVLRRREIHLRLWKYYVYSWRRDAVVPLVLLDSNVPENDEEARRVTDRLYKSDDQSGRLIQRLILGMGGIQALKVLGYPVALHHLNEGHAAFEKARLEPATSEEDLKKRFVYTCHTPVPAGHDRFGLSEIEQVMTPEDVAVVRRYGLEGDRSQVVNLTLLAMNTTSSVNAVSQKHGEVMRLQFPAYAARIRAVTNGVHFMTWVSPAILKVLAAFEEKIGDPREDPTLLGRVTDLKGDASFRKALWQAHLDNKRSLATLLEHWRVKDNVFSIAWARRIAAYKRPSLLFQDLERLKDISRRVGPLQVFFAGKAHPNDNIAFTYINEIMNAIDRAQDQEGRLRILMLENYDTFIAKTLVSGVDVWLNNPLPPYEASGTSGMKAMANGVVQLSTLDGWIIEAADRGIGRFFGHQDDGRSFSDDLVLRLDDDSKALYSALEEMAGIYYDRSAPTGHPEAWIDMMVNCLAEAGRFNTHRMVREYAEQVWGQR